MDAADRAGPPAAADPRLVSIHAYADPFANASKVLDCLRDAADSGVTGADPQGTWPRPEWSSGAFYDSLTFCATAIDSARAEGRLGVLPRLLARQAIMAVRLPDWDIAIPAAEEARRLATELGQPHLARHRRNGDRDDRSRPRRPGGDGARDRPCRADRAAARRHAHRRARPVGADLVGAGARSP